MNHHIQLFFAFISLTVIRVGCLKDVKVSIPHAVKEGHAAELRCTFELEGDALYTVKWYKSGQEFFRFTPKEDPPVKVFTTSGIDNTTVDKLRSNENIVKMRRVVDQTSGKYMCEVSADAPSFHTAYNYSIMTVVLAPESGPIITGFQSRYKQGDMLSARCTSQASKPAANITWILNDKHVDHSLSQMYRSETTNERGDLVTSQSHLTVALNFNPGRLKLKCISSIYSVYFNTTEKMSEIMGVRHRPDHFNQVYPIEKGTEEGHRRRKYNRPVDKGVAEVNRWHDPNWVVFLLG